MLSVERKPPTWNPDGWKFLRSSGQKQSDGRFKVDAVFGKSFSPKVYEKNYGPEVMDENAVTYYLPADWLERDRNAPGFSLYFSHTHWLAIREIHLSGLTPSEFDGRELPTIGEEEAGK